MLRTVVWENATRVAAKHGEKRELCAHRQRRDLESLKRKDKRRNRSTFGPSSHPLFLSGNTSCCWPKCLLHTGERTLANAPQAPDKRIHITVTSKRGVGWTFSHKSMPTHTHTRIFAWTTGRKRGGERERAVCPDACYSCVSQTAVGSEPSSTHFNSDLQVLEKSCERGRESRGAFAEGGGLESLWLHGQILLESSEGNEGRQKKKATGRRSKEKQNRVKQCTKERGLDKEFLGIWKKGKSGAAASRSQWNGPRCHLD